MNAVRSKVKSYYIYAALLALLAVCLSIAFSGSYATAFAADGEGTFSVVFPTAQYFQSNDPTLIAANDDYLLVYDETVSTLFVQGPKNTSYALGFEHVDDIFAVGSTAFINADGGYYSIDLKDATATVVQRELTSPENISFFSSDGTYLYAKSVAGHISVYDENLEIALDVDNVLNEDLLAGFPVLAGRDGLMYVFSTVFGNPFLVVYDPATGEESNGISMKCYVTKAYVGDIIYAQISTVSGGEGEPNIIGIDKQSGKELFKSDVTPDSFYACDNRLFAIEGNRIVIYTLNEDKSGLMEYLTISMAGSDLSHLNAPADVVKYQNSIAVADSNNDRISFISGASTMTELALEGSPLRLTSDGANLYALCDNGKIYKLIGSQIDKVYNTDGAVDIVYLDKLYILKNDGLYTSLGGGIHKLSDIADGKRISCANGGNNLYILKEGGISVLGKDGTLVTELSAELAGGKDIAIDYEGKLYVVYSDKVQCYVNKMFSVEMTDEVEFRSSFIRATVNSAYLDGDSLYFSADECFIGKMNAGCMEFSTQDNYGVAPYVPDGTENYYFAKVKDGATAYALPADGRADGLDFAPTETVLILNTDTGSGEGFRYALLYGKISIILENDFEPVLPAVSTADYVTTCDTVFYALPNINAGKIDIDEGTRFTRISDCADYEDGKWLRVSIGGGTYFAKASDCSEYTYVKPEEERVYAKAKATRVGGLVSIYFAAYENAGTLTQIVDGTKIEILEDHDDFYLVRYEDKTGFMRKDEVQLKGLTSVQIIAVVLAIFVTLTAICIFTVIETTKKKDSDKDKKAKQKSK